MSVSDLFNAAPAADRAEPERLTIRRPDDWHVHVRDGETMKAVLPFTAAQFKRGMIMPNLTPPMRSCADARAYRQRIRAALPAGCDFEPLMTCYLTDATSPDEIERGFRDRVWLAAKLYPAGATTNAQHGVTDIFALGPVFERMERIGMALLVHGEATDPEIDIFDREAVFMEQSLLPLLKRHAGLKVVVEHATTAETLDIVREHRARAACTITAHHLLYNRNAIFVGGIRPHYYCLPVLKREVHRQALLRAATSGSPKFFLGTDSAPHSAHLKEHACGCAGCYTAHAALELYATAFEAAGALDRLEGFASFHGPDFYGLPRNNGSVTLRRERWTPPEIYPFGDSVVKPLAGGEALGWRMAGAA